MEPIVSPWVIYAIGRVDAIFNLALIVALVSGMGTLHRKRKKRRDYLTCPQGRGDP